MIRGLADNRMDSKHVTIGGSPIPYLLGQTFIFGLGSTILCTAANTLFLTEFGPGHLPLIYVGLALFVPVVSFLYSAVYRRFSPVVIAVASAAMFMVLCFGGWFFEGRPGQGWVTYALLLGWNAYTLISHLIQGDQMQRLFNVREIKRAVPTVMAGAIVGIILGGLMVGPLTSHLGSSANLLLVSGALIPVNLVFVLRTIHRFPSLHGTQGSEPQRPGERAWSLRQLLGTRYVRLILIYGLCYGLAVRLIGFLFLSAAHELTEDPEKLSNLLGLSYSVGTAGSLFFVLFASTRLLNRFGLGIALAGTPIICAPLLLGATVALFFPELPLTSYVWFIVGAYLMTHVLDSGTTTTAVRTTLQALSVSERPSAEVAAKGLGPAVANGIAGLSLLALPVEDGAGLTWVLVFTMVICLCWIFCSRLLHNDYGKLLLDTFNRRALGASSLTITDERTLQVLDEYLESSDTRHAGLALEVLEDSEHPSYRDRVMKLAVSELVGMKMLALEHIELGRIAEALPLLEAELESHATPAIQAASLRAYCAILEADAVDRVKEALGDPDEEVQAGALVGLLRYGGISGVLAAGERLLSLQGASEPRDRMLLAKVAEKVGHAYIYQLILPLFQDEEIEVRRQALKAARNVKHTRVVACLIETLPDSRLRSRAMAALSEMGDVLVPTLSTALADRVYPGVDVVRLLRAIGETKSDPLVSVLRRHLDHPDLDVQTQVLRTLNSSHFQASKTERARIEEKLREEVGLGLRLLKAQLVTAGEPALAPLRRSLDFELAIRQTRTFLLLDFIHDSRAILRAEQRLASGDSNVKAMALESLGVILHGEMESAAYTLIDTSDGLEQRIEKLDHLFHTESKDCGACLLEFIFEKDAPCVHDWTRVWAIYGALHMDLLESGEALQSCVTDPSPLVREAASWTVNALEVGIVPTQLPTTNNSGIQAWFAPALAGEGNRMLLPIEKVALLQNVELFADIPESALHAIAAIAEEQDLDKGSTFIEEGTHGEGMYVIVDGEVKIHIHEKTLTNLGAGEVLGEIAIFDPGPRAASATAVVDSRLLWISKEDIQEAMADRPEIAQANLAVFARRLREALVQIDKLTQSS